LAVSKTDPANPPTEGAMAPPTLPSPADPVQANPTTMLDTHLGNHYYSPPYNPEWTGLIGNYVFYDYVANMEIYPEAFVIDTEAAGDMDRQEKTIPAPSVFDIEIPDELLNLN
jgi:hypothetical protein